MHEVFPSRLLSSGRPLTLRGAGHSCNGQTVTNGELLVTYPAPRATEQVRECEEHVFEVPAGMSWHSLQRHLNRHGRSAPVLTDYLDMSVGGTLSVGGAGVRSVRRGIQADHVERIQLIDGTGRSRWCSRTAEPELFRLALGGLGTLGLIERVVLRTIPYRRRTHLHRTKHSGISELTERTKQISQRDDVDVFWGSLNRTGSASAIGWEADDPERCGARGCSIVPDLPFVSHRTTTRVTTGPADRVRLWSDYVVPAGQFESMMRTFDGLRTGTLLGNVLTGLYLLIIRRPAEAPDFAFTPIGTAPASIGMGVYTSVRRIPTEIAAIRTVFRDLLDRCCELGGRPYLYGVHDLEHSLAEKLYGGDLTELARQRAALRLDHVNSHNLLARAAHRHSQG